MHACHVSKKKNYSLCQKKPTTHSELGFHDLPGRGRLTVDMVDSLYGGFKETWSIFGPPCLGRSPQNYELMVGFF